MWRTPLSRALRFVPLSVCSVMALACGDGEEGPAKKQEPPIAFVEGPLIELVDPLIGSGGVGFGVGSAYPGPARPFGMIHPGPDTSRLGRDPDITHYSGYNYDDPEILGFSHTRLQGTGAADLGNVLIMPVSHFDASMAVEQGYRSVFSKDTETASPGYYAVTLDDHGVRAELTSARRVAMHRYTFPSGADASIVLDPTHFAGQSGRVESATAQMGGDGRLRGSIHYFGPMSGRDNGVRIHYVVEADRPFTGTTAFVDGSMTSGDAFDGTSGGVVAHLGGDGVVHLKVAISFVDQDQALANMQAEADGFDFDAMRAEAEADWERILGRIRVAGGTETQQRIFYSALYRCFLMPTLFTEADGRYRGFDLDVHRADGFEYYTDFSLWDTFRTLHPLVTLMAPEYARDFAKSIERMIAQGGAVPRWALGTGYTNAMIGASTDIMIADTYLKGVTDFDVDFIYDAMRRQALEPKPDGARGPWRSGIEQYMANGYVPDRVSDTLEYAYDDWALANLAETLGRTDDVPMFRERAGNWESMWDPEAKQIRPPEAPGKFPTSFNELAHGGPYVEGNAVQWSWYVPHDAAGLLEAFGSEDAFVERLSTLFEESTTLVWVEGGSHHVLPDLHYWHSNEPVIHAAYLFNDVGRGDLARKWARVALDTQYRDGPDGLPGNDDGGTMSAWYLFAAMGFYPLAGGPDYWTGQPIFDAVRIEREEGDIEIRAPLASDDAADLGVVTIDGERVEGGRFSHEQIRRGATLRFEASE